MRKHFFWMLMYGAFFVVLASLTGCAFSLATFRWENPPDCPACECPDEKPRETT